MSATFRLNPPWRPPRDAKWKTIGFPLPESMTEGDIPGYQCWAEFYPVDASEASKNPAKQGDPVNCFIYSYPEFNGTAVSGISDGVLVSGCFASHHFHRIRRAALTGGVACFAQPFSSTLSRPLPGRILYEHA